MLRLKADEAAAENADRSGLRQIPAPFAGVVTLQVKEGDTVEAGQTIATIEAMKREAAITAPVSGTVERLAIDTSSRSRAATCSSSWAEQGLR